MIELSYDCDIGYCPTYHNHSTTRLLSAKTCLRFYSVFPSRRETFSPNWLYSVFSQCLTIPAYYERDVDTMLVTKQNYRLLCPHSDIRVDNTSAFENSTFRPDHTIFRVLSFPIHIIIAIPIDKMRHRRYRWRRFKQTRRGFFLVYVGVVNFFSVY